MWPHVECGLLTGAVLPEAAQYVAGDTADTVKEDCDNNPRGALYDLKPAAEKLGWPLEAMPHLYQSLAEWMARDYDGPNEHEAMATMQAIPCDQRTTAGRCNALGCGKSPEKTTYCTWLIRIGTRCPLGKFGATASQPNDS